MKILFNLYMSALLFPLCLNAQSFHEAGQYNISEERFLPDLYFTILSEHKKSAHATDTYSGRLIESIIVKIIRDVRGKTYHLVLKTDSNGDVSYVGCSLNLIEQAGQKPFLSPVFNKCIRSAIGAFSLIEKEKALLTCFLEILNKS